MISTLMFRTARTAQNTSKRWPAESAQSPATTRSLRTKICRFRCAATCFYTLHAIRLIFADSVHRGERPIVNSSVDYFMYSLINGDKCAKAEILNCLEATIKEGVGHIENRDAVAPLWNVADLDLPRVDEKFA